jgi:hypothetical protein
MWEDPETGERVPRVWKSFVDGRIPFSEMDDEELARLQVRNRNGDFGGTRPKMMPTALVQAHEQELMRRNTTLLKEVLLKATQVHIDVMNDENADPALRMRAAQYMQERLMGKTPDKMEIKAELKPWEGLISGILKSEDEG